MKTKKLLIAKSGVRYDLKYPPIWAQINMINNNCWCGTPKEKFAPRQRKYCTGLHATMWYYHMRVYWNTFRSAIFARDNYTCVICGFNKPYKSYPDESLFDADHIISLGMGGECYDEDNVRTLCKPCHKIKTKQDSVERAKKKRLNIANII